MNLSFQSAIRGFFLVGYLLISTLLPAQKFEFALIGDMPYQDSDVKKFETLVREINADRRIKWVMHTGDIKTGDSPCTDDYFQSRFNLYQKFTKPFIITPGDNEWTDCHRKGAGEYDPLDRLVALKRIFYQEPHFSLGQKTMPLATQMDLPQYQNYPENQRWNKKGVWFATCHMVGSNNGLAPFNGRTSAHDEEAEARTKAAIYWMQETFREAKDDRAIFLMIHANPRLEFASDSTKSQGFYTFLAALEEEIIRFAKPVLLAHGDSHYFRYDKPLLDRKTRRRIENFTRLETFGSGDIHWVRVLVNLKDPNIFQIRQELVESNFEEH